MTEISAFQKSASEYVHDLDAVREMLDPVMVMALTVRKKADKKHLDTLEALGTLKKEDAKKKIFDVPAEHIREVQRVAKRHARTETATHLLPRTFLVSFVSIYDAYLGRLIQALLETQPEVLDQSDRQLTYKQLLEFSSIDAARNRLVESEVESVLRQSHADQFKWLENKFKIKLRENLESWSEFIELTERRNLFVHTQGKVSNQYLFVCGTHRCGTEKTKIGSTLDADKKYLIRSYKCLYEIGIKLSQVFWRKLRPAELETADDALNTFAYELLVDEKYDIATRLLEFAVKLPRHSSDRSRRIFVINLAQAYKFSGDDAKSKALIDGEDWSSCGDDFAICISVLTDNFSEATATMTRVGTSGSVQEQAYMDWPVFKNFRERTEFKQTFLQVFGHEPSGVQKHDNQLESGSDNDAEPSA